jgi:endoglucanase
MSSKLYRWSRRTALWFGILAFAMACTAGTLSHLPKANTEQPEQPDMSVSVISPEIVVVSTRQGDVTHARQVPYAWGYLTGRG